MTEADCSRVFALLSEYLDKELAPGTCEELEAHVRDCPECIQFIDSLKRSIRLCREFGNSAPSAPIGEDAMAQLRRAYREMLHTKP